MSESPVERFLATDDSDAELDACCDVCGSLEHRSEDHETDPGDADDVDR